MINFIFYNAPADAKSIFVCRLHHLWDLAYDFRLKFIKKLSHYSIIIQLAL